MNTARVNDPVMQPEMAQLSHRVEMDVRRIGIPPCPAVLAELLHEMRTPSPDFREIALLIGTDPGLAAAILKTVNSPYYGLPVKATNVRRALLLLGLESAAQLITGLFLRQAFAAGGGQFMEQFWSSSSSIALVAAYLARTLGVGDRDEAHTFGLFRDAGMAVMYIQFPAYAAALAVATTAKTRFTDVEQAAVGADHACVGSKLAESWGLPEHVGQAILWHHVHDILPLADGPVPKLAAQLIQLAVVAEQLVRTRLGQPPTSDWIQGGSLALEALRIAPEQLIALGEGLAAV